MYFETELIALKIKQLISGEIFLPSRKKKSQLQIISVYVRISNFYKPTLDIRILVSGETCVYYWQCEVSWCLGLLRISLSLMSTLRYLMLHWTLYSKIVWMKAVNLSFAKKEKKEKKRYLKPHPGNILCNGPWQDFKTWLSFHWHKIPKQDSIGWPPTTTVSPLFPYHCPTTETEYPSFLPLQPPTAIGPSLGQRAAGFGGRFSYLSQRQKAQAKSPFVSILLSSFLFASHLRNVMPGVPVAFCDKAEKAQVPGDILEPLHPLQWPAFTRHVKWDE